jgi:hypothetical protein
MNWNVKQKKWREYVVKCQVSKCIVFCNLDHKICSFVKLFFHVTLIYIVANNII